MRTVVAGLAWIGLAGCMAGPEAGAETGGRLLESRAEIRNADGVTVATAQAFPLDGAVHLRVEATGLPPGTYGAHIHMIGRCDPPDFTSAGAHWNPDDREHGSDNPQGAHLGDLPNLTIGADGTGRLELHLDGASLIVEGHRLLDEDGSAIVIHAEPDDYRTDPTGNSGARIACGVFR